MEPERERSISDDVQREFPFRFPDLGFGGPRLLHLWEEAEFVASDGWRCAHDRALLLHRFRFNHDPGLPGPRWADLLSG